MKILFFDLENATSKGGAKICEFGYVVTDGSFSVTERGNYIINPNIRHDEWDWYVVRKVLTRKKNEYTKQPTFKDFYPQIRDLILSADYVVGHSLDGDAKAINGECIRYDLPAIDYDYIDERDVFLLFTDTKQQRSVANILVDLGVEGDTTEHDAEADACNTMIGFRAMLERSGLSLEDFCRRYAAAKGRSENYRVILHGKKNKPRRHRSRAHHGERTEKPASTRNGNA